MIKIHVAEDMLDHMTNQDMVVHGCNAQGVMGAGIAKQIKRRYPAAFASYRNAYKNGLGTLTLNRGANTESDDPIICNMITQEFIAITGSDARMVSYDALEYGFDKVFQYANKHELNVHFPLIGAGLGGGDWMIISAIIGTLSNRHNILGNLWVQTEEQAQKYIHYPYHFTTFEKHD